MTALEDWVVIEPRTGERETPGGIVLPDVVKSVDVIREGTVVSVGPGRLTDTGRRLEISPELVGRLVAYRAKQAVEFQHQGRNLAAVRVVDVVMVI